MQREQAPGRGVDPGAHAELLPVDVSFGDALQVFNVGPASVGTFGMPAGLCEAAARFGTVPLERLVGHRTAPLFVSRRLVRDGKAAHREAERRGWEGIIAKDERSPYQPGVRSPFWRKVKVRKESEFVIGGYTAPKGGRQHLGALLVGLYDGPKLRYVGKVGTGFTQETLDMLATKFERLRTAKPPFDPAPRMKDATWVRPKLVAQLVYAEWTADGKLRQPAFLGLRTDKSPSECTWSGRER